MKYLKNIKSYFSTGKAAVKPKTFSFDSSDVIENIENSLVELDDQYKIKITHEFQEKFTITIYKHAKMLSETNFKFYDVKEQVLFMLHLIKSSYIMNEINVYFRGSKSMPKEMTFSNIEDLEKASNIETSGIIIYFYLS